MERYPKVLILSNECLSSGSSNGRTLRNFLAGWPKDKLAQFHIRSIAPDYNVCDNYYCVSDSAALRSFVTFKPAEPKLQTQAAPNASDGRQCERNAVTMMLRNLVWNSMRWAGKGFYRWVEKFSPELILLQAGDCAFMLKLARNLSLKYSVPLVIYNSEAYYFKNYDYFGAHGLAKMLYPLFRFGFRRQFVKTLRIAKKTIYGCDRLQHDYDAEFGLPSETIYTVTEVSPSAEKCEHDGLRVTYLGNLGVGRHEGLVEIANALQQISGEYKLDIYGRMPNERVKECFDNCPGIRYNGFVGYDEVIRIMQDSDILVHTENFSEFYKENLKYAFSTKIADSLAVGNCFLLYAPRSMACSEYLIDNEAAYVVGEQEELLPLLKELCADSEMRLKYTANALRLVKKNHDPVENVKRFRTILQESAKD